MRNLILTSLFAAAFAVAQTPVQTDSATVTKTEQHGKKVKTDSSSATTSVDSDGTVSKETSSSATTAKKKHGKVKKQTTATESSSSTTPPQP